MDGLPFSKGSVQHRAYRFEYAQKRREYKFHMKWSRQAHGPAALCQTKGCHRNCHPTADGRMMLKGITPAMAAGVTDRVWDMNDVAALIAAQEALLQNADRTKRRQLSFDAAFRKSWAPDGKSANVPADAFAFNEFGKTPFWWLKQSRSLHHAAHLLMDTNIPRNRSILSDSPIRPVAKVDGFSAGGNEG